MGFWEIWNGYLLLTSFNKALIRMVGTRITSLISIMLIMRHALDIEEIQRRIEEQYQKDKKGRFSSWETAFWGCDVPYRVRRPGDKLGSITHETRSSPLLGAGGANVWKLESFRYQI
jgi:hypothetical protein